MNNKLKTKTSFSLLAIILLYSIIQSCGTSTKIIVQNDIVYSTKRIELKYSSKDVNRRSPLLFMEQSVVKEIKANDEITYQVFDVLTMNSSSFKLEDKVFLIIDNDFFPMQIENKEFEYAKSFTQNTQNILTSDSTTISVVTGYSEDNRKITRFSYKLSTDIINKLKNSNQVIFRYYSGPSMISVEIKDKNLRKLKALIEKN